MVGLILTGLLIFSEAFSPWVVNYDRVANFIFFCILKLLILKDIHSWIWTKCSIYKTRVTNFFWTKSPCGRPYFDRVANFSLDVFPHWVSLIMTRSLIYFWQKTQGVCNFDRVLYSGVKSTREKNWCEAGSFSNAHFVGVVQCALYLNWSHNELRRIPSEDLIKLYFFSNDIFIIW